MSGDQPPARGGTGLAQLAGGRPSLMGALGGPLGLLEATVPGLLFAVVYAVTPDLRTAVIWALGSAAVIVVARLATRTSPSQALAGAVVVGISAFVAARTGRAETFFLPSIIKNGAYAAAYALSVVVRWPLIGVLVGPLVGEWFAWRQAPARLRAYRQATWFWVALFLVRLAVQVPLYLAGAVSALGAASVALGWPLFAITLWASWLVLRRVPVVPGQPPAALERLLSERRPPS